MGNQSKSIAILQLNKAGGYVERIREQLLREYGQIDTYGMQTDMSAVFDHERYALIVVAGAKAAPIATRDAVERYLSNGGRMLVLGGPPFSELLLDYQGEMVNQDEYRKRVARDVVAQDSYLIFDTTDDEAHKAFFRASSNPKSEIRFEYGDFGLPGSAAQMKYIVEDFQNWETCNVPVHMTLTDVNAIGFYAKSGDAHTPYIGIELTDSNGSRWVASVTLTQEWNYYLLTATDFKWWGQSARTERKHPDFSQTRTFTFNFALSTRLMAKGYHSAIMAEPRFLCLDARWLDNVNIAPSTLAIDGLYPEHEMYPVTNAATIVTEPDQIFVQPREYVLPQSLISCYPGRLGTGYGKRRVSRFIPLLRVTDDKGLHSGYAAWMHVLCGTTEDNKAIEGAIVGCFSACSDDFYDENGVAAVVEAVRAMLYPVYLLEGGTDEYTYITDDQPDVVAGASFIDFGREQNMDIFVALYEGDVLLDTVESKCATVEIQENGVKSFSGVYPFGKATPTRAVTTLYLDGQMVDRISQDIAYWQAKPLTERHYVYKEDGYFKRDGKIVNFYGVNYVPSYNIAEPVFRNFEIWTNKASYDPVVVTRDLQHIKDMGFNAVSLGLHGLIYPVDSNNMLDVIRICEDMGIYVDLAIRGDTHYHEEFIYLPKETMETLVLQQHFQENDNIVAYDINWERRIGWYRARNYLGRERWNADWEAWIVAQYGSVAHAEELWGCPIYRNEEGNVIGADDQSMDAPTPEQYAMLTAYYRFMDDIVAKEFGALVTHLKSIDPHHLISFRMSMSGSALEQGEGRPSTGFYDFQSLASTMDFMSPEAYLIFPNDLSMLQILFANLYARYTAPNSPVVWKEFGTSIWNGSSFADNTDLLEDQRNYYAYFLDYAYRSYTSALYPWWYAGGLRYNEGSDCGLLNPDGSDRPCTQVFRDYADKFIHQGARPAAKTLLAVERDEGGRGIYGMFDQIKDEMRAAFDKGDEIALVNHMQNGVENGKYYADTTLGMALGGTKAQGQYPLRYVNGQIKNVEAVTRDGKVCLKVTVCNTLPSTWRAGTVSLISTAESGVFVRQIIDREVGYLEDVVLTVPAAQAGDAVLRFELGGIAFGMPYRSTLQ